MSKPLEISVRVVPRASRQKVEVLPDGVVKIWTPARPVDGQANAAVLEALSDFLGTPKSRIQIVRGHSSKMKAVSIESPPIDALAKLQPPATLFDEQNSP